MPGWRIAKDIDKRLRDLRSHLDWGQADLGLATGRNAQAVSGWETRKNVPTKSTLERLARYLNAPVAIFSEGGPMPSKAVKRPAPGTAPSASGLADADGDPEGPGWLWEDPSEAEEAFRTYIRNVERSVRGMVGDPDGVKLKELRLLVIDMARSGARAAGRTIPPFVHAVENEVISGTFR